MVEAVVPGGKKKGKYIGKVAVRSSGYFNISTPCGVVQGISYKHCKLIHRADGFSYGITKRKDSAPLQLNDISVGVSAQRSHG
jgi:hypothetical protein